MLIFNKSTLAGFWRTYPDAKAQLEAWYEEAYKARWNNPHDIKAMYRNASVLKNNRVVFNIAGNKYRLVVETDFARHWLFVRFLGTHTEYDKINAETYNGFEADKK
jgi:mRNA interferase HigB